MQYDLLNFTDACRKMKYLAAEGGANAKAVYIASNKTDGMFLTLLFYALNPRMTYHLSEKTLSEGETAEPRFDNLPEWCEYLSKQKGIDDATAAEVRGYLETLSHDEKEIAAGILSKTLRLGVTEVSVNKVIPNLIPEWEVQQAYSIEKYPVRKGTEFWLTQKLNGVRATVYDGQIIGRSGAPFEGLDHITKDLEEYPDIVFDGELLLKNKGNLSDNEAFRTATGIINSDAEDKTEICFTVFDVIPKDEFDGEAEAVTIYSKRRQILDSMRESVSGDHVRILPCLYHGSDTTQIDALLDRMVQEDKEGLMVNFDTPYRRTRHKGILKVKRFYTMDLPVIGYEEGVGRLKGTLGALILDYKGNPVNVGTGFTYHEREECWQNKDRLIGTLCEVKYKEVSSDKKTGRESLQFPVFVRFRKDKTKVSYH